MTLLYDKKIQRYELFDKKQSLKIKERSIDNQIYKVQKISEKDQHLGKIIKFIFGFRENPEFLFRILRFLDDIRISSMNYANQERKKIDDNFDNSFFYFISNNFYNNFKDDEYLALIYRLLKEQINENYNNFLEENSVLYNLFKEMLIQIDMKIKLKEILYGILLKIEELSDEEFLLDIFNINKFIYKLKESEKKGTITEKVKNLFLNPKQDILKQDERLFRRFTKFNIKELINDNYEEKNENIRGFIFKIKTLLKLNNEEQFELNEKKCDIKNFYNFIYQNSINPKLCIIIYRHYFLKVRKILHLIIDTFISKINYIPNIINCICKIIYILCKNSYKYIFSNYEIFSMIGKFFFENLINFYLFEEKYTVMLDFFPLSNYSKQNLETIKFLLLNLFEGNIFSINNNPNLIPFNSLFFNELFPKLFNFYKSLTITENTNYIENLISGKIKENNFEYDFFDIYPNEIFSNMSFCFNLKNSNFLLTLLESFIGEKNRENFYKRGDKLCINNMKQYFGDISSYGKKTNFDENIFYLYYNNISEEFDLENENDESQIIFSIDEQNLQEIESEEEFKENEEIKMKNRLCLLLYKMNDLDEEIFTKEEKNNFSLLINKLIIISKEDSIGKTLKILLKKKELEENNFNSNIFFEELNELIEEYSKEFKESYNKMTLANENLRNIQLNKINYMKYNENLLLYNTYLDLDKLLGQNQYYITPNINKRIDNFIQFLDDFYNIKDNKLDEYYNQKITDDFIDNKIILFPNEDEEEEINITNYPQQIKLLIEYLNIFKENLTESYYRIIIDYISAKIYDNLIIHKPDKYDVILFNNLIKDNLIYQANKIENPDSNVIDNIRKAMKKYVNLKGVFQKTLAIEEVKNIFQKHFSFIKGKNESIFVDDEMNYMCFSISKLYLKTLVLVTKYLSIFSVDRKTISTISSALSHILIEDIKCEK